MSTFLTGRRLAFAVSLVAAAAVTALEFATLNAYSELFWMIPLVGFCQLALFGGYSIYFPELFPTHLRGTGGGLCFNLGRLFAAPILIIKGWLMNNQGYSAAEAASLLSLLFLLGILLLPFAPETKGRDLPS